MDQDAAWYGGKPWPKRRSVRWGRSSPVKGAQPPVFGSCLLWPNGWIDGDATLHRSTCWPRRHCVRRGPSSPRKGHNSLPLFGPCLLWPRSPISATAVVYVEAYTYVRSGSLIHPAVWPQQTWAKLRGCARFGARQLDPCTSNTMWPGPRSTSMSSFILIDPTVWPQYTNVTERQTGNGRIVRGNRFTNGRPKTVLIYNP